MWLSCLVDTGSVVSTGTESCFQQHFEPWGQDRLQSCQWLVVSLDVPGMLGMNILGWCYQELFGQHGTALFDLPIVKQLLAMSSALQYCQQVSARKHSDQVGCVASQGAQLS